MAIANLSQSVLAHLERLPDAWADHPVAWLCRELALDLQMAGPEQAAGLARELRAALADLTALAPAEARNDGVDQIAARRDARRAAAAG